jgi:DNA-binding ferritin-like protein
MPNQIPNQTMKQSLNQLNEESTDGDESITENTVLAPSEISTISANAIENKQIDKNTMLSLNKLTINLLNYQVVLKLYHFQTELYGSHKTIDSYLDKYAQTMDKFLEIAQGIYGKITIKKYKFNGSSHTDENIIKQLDGMIYLLRTKINNILGTYTDLINVRDELVGDIEQLKYLLRFK